MGLSTLAFAGPYAVDKTVVKGSPVLLQNYQTLRNIAISEGKVRIDLLLQLPSAVNGVNTPAEVQARQAAVNTAVQNFTAQYAGKFQGSLVNSSITPMISGEFLVTGVDQLWNDASVVYFSEYGRYQPMLRQVNEIAQSGSISTGATSNQIIAIVDSGVDLNHTELSGRVVAGYCYSTPSGNFLNGSPLPSLCSGAQGAPATGKACVSPNADLNAALVGSCRHGTHVAGIAASSTSFAATSGLAPNAKIMSFMTKSVSRIIGPAPNPQLPYQAENTSVDLVRALDQLKTLRTGTPTVPANPNIAVANMSLGAFPQNNSVAWGINGCRDSDLPLASAVQLLSFSGVQIVASAGNRRNDSGVLVDYGLSYPACDPTVLSVASTNKQSQTVAYSVYGFPADPGSTPALLPSILAPGGANVPAGLVADPSTCVDSSNLNTPVCSTRANQTSGGSQRDQRSGTSMSAPVVAGAIARVRNRFPHMSGAQVAQALIASGRQIPIPERANVLIPEVSLQNTFDYLTAPQNVQSTGGCRVLNWSSPRQLQATGYRVRSASSETGLSNATAINAGNVLTFSFPQNGFAQVLAFDAQGDGAWSSAVALNSSACAPAAVANFRASTTAPAGTSGCFHGVEWNPTGGATEYRLEEVCLGGSPSGVEAIAATRLYKRLQRSNHTSCTAGDKANYRVQACNSGDCGPWSAVVQQTPVLLACSFTD